MAEDALLESEFDVETLMQDPRAEDQNDFDRTLGIRRGIDLARTSSLWIPAFLRVFHCNRLAVFLALFCMIKEDLALVDDLFENATSTRVVCWMLTIRLFCCSLALGCFLPDVCRLYCNCRSLGFRLVVVSKEVATTFNLMPCFLQLESGWRCAT